MLKTHWAGIDLDDDSLGETHLMQSLNCPSREENGILGPYVPWANVGRHHAHNSAIKQKRGYCTCSRESANFAISRKNQGDVRLLLLLLLLNKAWGPRSHNKKLPIAEKCIALRHPRRTASSAVRCRRQQCHFRRWWYKRWQIRRTILRKAGPRKEAKEEERE